MEYTIRDYFPKSQSNHYNIMMASVCTINTVLGLQCYGKAMGGEQCKPMVLGFPIWHHAKIIIRKKICMHFYTLTRFSLLQFRFSLSHTIARHSMPCIHYKWIIGEQSEPPLGNRSGAAHGHMWYICIFSAIHSYTWGKQTILRIWRNMLFVQEILPWIRLVMTFKHRRWANTTMLMSLTSVEIWLRV